MRMTPFGGTEPNARSSVMVVPLSERMLKMLQRTRVGNGRNRYCERQHQDHTCDPNLHTSLPKSRPRAP